MPFETNETDNELIVIDPSMFTSVEVSPHSSESLEVVDFGDHDDHSQHEHEHEHEREDHSHNQHEHEHEDKELNIFDSDSDVIIVEELPGAPKGTVDPEPEPEQVVEVVEEQESDDSSKKKNEKWDWESKGATGFVAWIKERLESVPTHSGYDSSGLERAMAYLDRLDNEISKAMRLDLDGDLDANKIEEVRSKIDDGVARLQKRLDKVKKAKKSNRKKKSEFEQNDSFVKEAQKITGVQGVFVTVPLLISGIARLCINSVVSAGYDLESVYDEQVDKFKLNDREKSEVKWLLHDMGFSLRDNNYPSENNSNIYSNYISQYKG